MIKVRAWLALRDASEKIEAPGGTRRVGTLVFHVKQAAQPPQPGARRARWVRMPGVVFHVKHTHTGLPHEPIYPLWRVVAR